MKKLKVYDSLSEKELGITEYISTNSGFDGIIKSRYTDFHVHEIDLDGNVVELTNLRLPIPPAEPFTSAIDNVPDIESYLVEKQLLTTDQWESVKSVVQTRKPFEIDVTDLTKEQRTEIHHGIKKHFQGLLFTNTTSNETKKFINFQFHKNKSKIIYYAKYF